MIDTPCNAFDTLKDTDPITLRQHAAGCDSCASQLFADELLTHCFSIDQPSMQGSIQNPGDGQPRGSFIAALAWVAAILVSIGIMRVVTWTPLALTVFCLTFIATIPCVFATGGD